MLYWLFVMEDVGKGRVIGYGLYAKGNIYEYFKEKPS